MDARRQILPVSPCLQSLERKGHESIDSKRSAANGTDLSFFRLFKGQEASWKMGGEDCMSQRSGRTWEK